MVVLVCGSRRWKDKKVLWEHLDTIHQICSITKVIEGDARGADNFAGGWARHNDIELVEVPADWDTYGRSAGMIRNSKMISMCPDLVIAFIRGESYGTWHTVGLAEAHKIPVRVIRWPLGPCQGL